MDKKALHNDLLSLKIIETELQIIVDLDPEDVADLDESTLDLLLMSTERVKLAAQAILQKYGCPHTSPYQPSQNTLAKMTQQRNDYKQWTSQCSKNYKPLYGEEQYTETYKATFFSQPSDKGFVLNRPFNIVIPPGDGPAFYLKCYEHREHLKLITELLQNQIELRNHSMLSKS